MSQRRHSIADYIRDPAPKPSLSASIAHILLTRSPRHAWMAHPRLNKTWEPGSTPESDLGSIAHAILLEGDESQIVVIEANDWRTADARAKRDAARAEGKLPILAAKRAEVFDMVVAARKAIKAAPEIQRAMLRKNGKAERTRIWQEGESYCRCRPDWETNDHRLIIDYKTTGASAEPDSWMRGQMLSMGYDVQAAFCLRAVRQLYKPREASFVFMVQEVEAPYAVSFVGLSPEFEAFAERKRVRALEIWQRCLQTKSWPGYPERVCWAEPPAWAMTRWDEKQVVGGTVEDL